ncbi:MAG TPA: hypothetical protein VMS77_00875 [Conexivisphaerales archaeon]|nr:hypothetical protein [Conexivisphaerales archaeon]
MKMVKVAAILLMPLLMASFLTVVPAMAKTQTYKLEMFAQMNPSSQPLISQYTTSDGHYWFWECNWKYDLSLSYNPVSYQMGSLIGYKWIHMWGVVDLWSTPMTDTFIGIGTYTFTDTSMFGRAGTGAFTLLCYSSSPWPHSISGTWVIVGGTGSLAGIHGQGSFIPDVDPDTTHYLGTVWFSR